MSALATEIRSLMTQKGWNQKQLAEKSGINQAVISRILTGKHQRPSNHTIKSIAQALETTEAHLLAFVSHTGPSKLRIGFVHSLWAAPFVLEAQEKQNDRISHASYGIAEQEQHWSANHPYWYNTALAKQREVLLADPSNPIIRFYTESDLIHLSMHHGSDDQTFDGIIVPSKTAEYYKHCHLECAQFLYMPPTLGCVVVQKKTRQQEIPSESTDQVLHMLKGCKGHELSIICSPGTMAEKSVMRVLEPLRGLGIKIDMQWVEWKNWPYFESQATQLLTEKGRLAFCGFEPHLSWMISLLARLKAEGADVEWSETDDIFHLLNCAPKEWYTLDLLFNKAFLKRQADKQLISHYLSWLGTSYDAIVSASRPNFPSIQRVAQYFFMDPQRCFTALSKLRFWVMYYPSWAYYLERGQV